MNENYCRVEKNHWCIGCGICEQVFPGDVDVELNDDGAYSLCVHGKIEETSFSDICPVINNRYLTKEMWGNIEKGYYGWCTDSTIRKKASSGGIITAIALYLLESDMADGIVQVCASSDKPIENIVTVSQNKEEIISCTGSRYAPVKMLSLINNLLEDNKRYAFIGKPCDVRALQNYCRLNPEVEKKIVCTLSFFCAGTPILGATKEVISKMGKDVNKCISFSYRGNGWPGFTVAEFSDGCKKQMTYSDSWGKILGRSLHTACRFCVDGVGVTADIACGDAWYCDERGYPLFDERDGRNVVLVRNELGLTIVNQMIENGLIIAEQIENIEDKLRNFQPYQYKRKAMMLTKLRILRILRKDTPEYPSELKEWDKHVKIAEKINYAKGTILRVLKARL